MSSSGPSTAEQRKMTDEEIDQLFLSDAAKDIRSKDLYKYFTETCNLRYLEVFPTAALARVHDYLHSNEVAVGKGCGQPIVDCLLKLFPPPTATTAARVQSQAGA